MPRTETAGKSPVRRGILFGAVALLGLPPGSPAAEDTVIRVDAQAAAYRMAGGIGASWHAEQKVKPGHRGSAWGGNPPLDNAKAWKQVGDHARWLGLDWIRVELSQRMYEPRREQFDWENDEMRDSPRRLHPMGQGPQETDLPGGVRELRPGVGRQERRPAHL